MDNPAKDIPKVSAKDPCAPSERTPKELLASLPLAFLGVGFARAWLALLFAAPTLRLPSWEVTPHVVFDVGYVLCAVAMAFWARSRIPLNGVPSARVLAGALMAAASALAVASYGAGDALGSAAPALSLAAAVAGGVGFLLFSLLNIEAYSTLGTLRLMLCLSAAYVLGSVLAFFGQGMATAQLALLLVLLPLVACACVGRAWSSTAAADRPRAVYPKVVYPWKLYALMALYSFAYGLRQSDMVQGTGRGSTMATLAIMAVLFVALWRFSARLELLRLSQAPMLFMVCGFLLLPAQSFLGDVASSWFVSVSYTLMHVFTFMLLCRQSRTAGVPVVLLAAPFYATQAFTLLGVGTVALLASLGFSSVVRTTVFAIALAASIILITILMVSELKSNSAWTFAGQSGSVAAEAQRAERLASRCDELSSRYHLSPREDEIMRLLAQRLTMAAIAKNLVIAQGTVKAHVRHIYEKMGINSRTELYALLGID